jgi:putative Mn2+ efflux pump MntP
MGILELLTLAVALSMDAFAVAICQGLSMGTINRKRMLTIGIYFGTFQAVMPLIGWVLGSSFQGYVTQIDHWVASALLGIIGINMVRESFQPTETTTNPTLSTHWELLLLAIATSIDALTVGITFAFLEVNIVLSVVVIGVCTCVLSMVGVCIGSKFGAKHESKAKLFGGIVLIALGLKVLLGI